MKRLALIAALIAAPLAAAPEPSPAAQELTLPASARLAAGAPATAWRAIDPADLLVMDTGAGTMILQLAPEFAPQHIARIRALVAAGRFDGGAITRVQDNYVVQWAARPDPAPLPHLPDEYERPQPGLAFTPLGYVDAFGEAGYAHGWPVARAGAKGPIWPVHCYGSVGVGRDNPPDNGDGSELYAVIGHAPRHLDRNLAVVGRVIEGLPAHAALKRGTEALGFYATEAERTPITRVQIGSSMADPPQFEVMDTASPSFAALIKARASRSESFFVRPAGATDVCNVVVPVRRVAP